MVFICDSPFEQTGAYASHFETFPHLSLSPFQKWAFKAIVDGDHTLITAHTGSGKTLPAEFAIKHFIAQGKKVIYTAPIKALSNTKLHDLRQKYPDISFGIITGDVSDNPEADVLIMTTEILPMTLMNRKVKNAPLAFEIDIENDLAAVVFDEVHYINDADRGHVWEQAILLLPPQVQLIMLSATIDNPGGFAGWVEQEKRVQSIAASQLPKQVYMASTNHRVVPLTHYLWFTCHKSSIKSAKGTSNESLLIKHSNKPVPLKDANGKFHDDNYTELVGLNKHLKNVRITRQHVLNGLIRHLKNENGLPAICFVFSRRQVEIAAGEVNFSLFEEDSTIPSTIANECKQMLMRKLPNYREYIELPEYKRMIDLFQKGIGIHHAGILSVFREITEMLFERKMLKLLFATETLAVGINFSTSSVIYTGIHKFDGDNSRLLAPHEYTQISGRAGRRGIDTVGKVWLCANLIEMPTLTECKQMLCGKPQILSSKFKLSFALTLSLVQEQKSVIEFANQSLLTQDVTQELRHIDERIAQLEKDLEAQPEYHSEWVIIKQYWELTKKLAMSSNKQKKRIYNEIRALETEHPSIKVDYQRYDERYECERRIEAAHVYRENTEKYLETVVRRTTDLMTFTGFVDTNGQVTQMGRFASQFQEFHPLAITQLMEETECFRKFGPKELAGVFAVCVPSGTPEVHVPSTSNHQVNTISGRLRDLLNEYYDLEQRYDICSGANYETGFDLQPHVLEWCFAEEETKCREILQNLPMFLGEFVKCLLKINHMAAEVERAAEMANRLDLVAKMKEIPKHTLKFIATNHSLYI